MANDTLQQSTSSETDWRDRVTWYTHETTVLHLVRFAGRTLFRPLARVECIGFENIPRSGPCIFASNHITNLDMIFYGANLPRHPFTMAKKELFAVPVLGWGLRKCGAFPVDRSGGDVWALEQAGRILAAGQMLFIFPEGTRGGRAAQLRKGKAGSVKLALDYKAPLIPAAILGTHNFRLSWRPNNFIRMQVGEPLDVATLAGPPPYTYGTLRELTTLLMQRIAALLPPEHRGFYRDAVK